MIVICFSIIFEAIAHLLSNDEINSDYLLLISILGLFVNIFGLVLLWGSHHHSHDHTADTSLSNEAHEENMKSVILHIFTDALGSVGNMK